jgi:hypothetical protein
MSKLSGSELGLGLDLGLSRSDTDTDNNTDNTGSESTIGPVKVIASSSELIACHCHGDHHHYIFTALLFHNKQVKQGGT